LSCGWDLVFGLHGLIVQQLFLLLAAVQ
jgi:hypothetical protein